METNHASHRQHAGPGRLMAAVSAALLLACALVAGTVPSLRSPEMGAALVEADGTGHSPALAADDAGRLAVCNRSPAYAKASRSQFLAGGASGPEIPLPPAVLPAVLELGCPTLRVAGEGQATDRHAAANGHLSRRIPTGPPSRPSRTV